MQSLRFPVVDSFTHLSVVRFVHTEDTGSYASSNIATGRSSHSR